MTLEENPTEGCEMERSKTGRSLLSFEYNGHIKVQFHENNMSVVSPAINEVQTGHKRSFETNPVAGYEAKGDRRAQKRNSRSVCVTSDPAENNRAFYLIVCIGYCLGSESGSG